MPKIVQGKKWKIYYGPDFRQILQKKYTHQLFVDFNALYDRQKMRFHELIFLQNWLG